MIFYNLGRITYASSKREPIMSWGVIRTRIISEGPCGYTQELVADCPTKGAAQAALRLLEIKP